MHIFKMTDHNTDNEEAIRLEQAELKKNERELERLGVPSGTPITTTPIAAG